MRAGGGARRRLVRAGRGRDVRVGGVRAAHAVAGRKARVREATARPHPLEPQAAPDGGASGRRGRARERGSSAVRPLGRQRPGPCAGGGVAQARFCKQLTVCCMCRSKCSPPSGCGVRSTSTTSSCPLPSTAPGPRGTPTLTTAPGKLPWHLLCRVGSRETPSLGCLPQG
jgi:hypothetical protein